MNNGKLFIKKFLSIFLIFLLLIGNNLFLSGASEIVPLDDFKTLEDQSCGTEKTFTGITNGGGKNSTISLADNNSMSYKYDNGGITNQIGNLYGGLPTQKPFSKITNSVVELLPNIVRDGETSISTYLKGVDSGLEPVDEKNTFLNGFNNLSLEGMIFDLDRLYALMLREFSTSLSYFKLLTGFDNPKVNKETYNNYKEPSLRRIVGGFNPRYEKDPKEKTLAIKNILENRKTDSNKTLKNYVGNFNYEVSPKNIKTNIETIFSGVNGINNGTLITGFNLDSNKSMLNSIIYPNGYMYGNHNVDNFVKIGMQNPNDINTKNTLNFTSDAKTKYGVEDFTKKFGVNVVGIKEFDYNRTISSFSDDYNYQWLTGRDKVQKDLVFDENVSTYKYNLNNESDSLTNKCIKKVSGKNQYKVEDSSCSRVYSGEGNLRNYFSNRYWTRFNSWVQLPGNLSFTDDGKGNYSHTTGVNADTTGKSFYFAPIGDLSVGPHDFTKNKIEKSISYDLYFKVDDLNKIKNFYMNLNSLNTPINVKDNKDGIVLITNEYYDIDRYELVSDPEQEYVKVGSNIGDDYNDVGDDEFKSSTKNKSTLITVKSIEDKLGVGNNSGVIKYTFTGDVGKNIESNYRIKLLFNNPYINYMGYSLNRYNTLGASLFKKDSGDIVRSDFPGLNTTTTKGFKVTSIGVKDLTIKDLNGAVMTSNLDKVGIYGMILNVDYDNGDSKEVLLTPGLSDSNLEIYDITNDKTNLSSLISQSGRNYGLKKFLLDGTSSDKKINLDLLDSILINNITKIKNIKFIHGTNNLELTPSIDYSNVTIGVKDCSPDTSGNKVELDFQKNGNGLRNCSLKEENSNDTTDIGTNIYFSGSNLSDYDENEFYLSYFGQDINSNIIGNKILLESGENVIDINTLNFKYKIPSSKIKTTSNTNIFNLEGISLENDLKFSSKQIIGNLEVLLIGKLKSGTTYSLLSKDYINIDKCENVSIDFNNGNLICGVPGQVKVSNSWKIIGDSSKTKNVTMEIYNPFNPMDNVIKEDINPIAGSLEKSYLLNEVKNKKVKFSYQLNDNISSIYSSKEIDIDSKLSTLNNGCQEVGSYCGDNIVQSNLNEECEIGDGIGDLAGFKCNNLCKYESIKKDNICWDGILDLGEQCEKGGLVNPSFSLGVGKQCNQLTCKIDKIGKPKKPALIFPSNGEIIDVNELNEPYLKDTNNYINSSFKLDSKDIFYNNNVSGSGKVVELIISPFENELDDVNASIWEKTTIQIGKDSKFDSPDSIVYEINKGDGSYEHNRLKFVVDKELLGSKIFYWRVKYTDNLGYDSYWSDIGSFGPEPKYCVVKELVNGEDIINEGDLYSFKNGDSLYNFGVYKKFPIDGNKVVLFTYDGYQLYNPNKNNAKNIGDNSCPSTYERFNLYGSNHLIIGKIQNDISGKEGSTSKNIPFLNSKMGTFYNIFVSNKGKSNLSTIPNVGKKELADVGLQNKIVKIINNGSSTSQKDTISVEGESSYNLEGVNFNDIMKDINFFKGYEEDKMSIENGKFKIITDPNEQLKCCDMKTQTCNAQQYKCFINTKTIKIGNENQEVKTYFQKIKNFTEYISPDDNKTYYYNKKGVLIESK